MKFILGKKQNMTQVFDEEGNSIPVTVLEAGPMVVTQVKTKDKDGYSAVQVGFGERNPKRINKPLKGHLKDLGSFMYLREFKVADEGQFKVGDKIDSSVFAPGDVVKVTSTSKGKGFQ